MSSLRTLTAKSVCNAWLQVFQLVGIPSTIRLDCASNFTSSLTTTFLKSVGCNRNFSVPGRPQQSGLCERLIDTLKNLINKVASDNPKSWHKHLGYVLCAIRETPNLMTGVRPALLAWGVSQGVRWQYWRTQWLAKWSYPWIWGKLPVNIWKNWRKILNWFKIMLRHIHRRLSNDIFRGIICEPEKSHLRLDRNFWF